MQKIWILKVWDSNFDVLSHYAFSSRENAFEYGKKFLPEGYDKQDYENFEKVGNFCEMMYIKCVALDSGQEI